MNHYNKMQRRSQKLKQKMTSSIASHFFFCLFSFFQSYTLLNSSSFLCLIYRFSIFQIPYMGCFPILLYWLNSFIKEFERTPDSAYVIIIFQEINSNVHHISYIDEISIFIDETINFSKKKKMLKLICNELWCWNKTSFAK